MEAPDARTSCCFEKGVVLASGGAVGVRQVVVLFLRPRRRGGVESDPPEPTPMDFLMRRAEGAGEALSPGTEREGAGERVSATILSRRDAPRSTQRDARAPPPPPNAPEQGPDGKRDMRWLQDWNLQPWPQRCRPLISCDPGIVVA